MQTIIITGSVGTGKTTLAKKLAKQKGYIHLEVSKLIKANKLYDYYDKKRKSYVVDIKKLNRFLIKQIDFYKKAKTKGIIIDSHMSHFLPKKYVDLCIVTKCDLKQLKKRLEKRSYGEAKVRENLDCEIFDICLNEAKERGYKGKVIDKTQR